MHDDDQPTSSTPQDAWIEICETLRWQLAAQVTEMAAMKPDEIKALVEAAREAIFLERDAHCFDKDVEVRMDRFTD